jgi:hypothetical protein
MTLRPATTADLEFLVALRETTMRRHFENNGQAYLAAEQYQRVAYQLEQAKIIVVGNADIGLLKLKKPPILGS